MISAYELYKWCFGNFSLISSPLTTSSHPVQLIVQSHSHHNSTHSMQLFLANSLAAIALAMSSIAAIPSPERPKDSAACDKLTFPSRTIFQFESNATWIENFSVGPEGDLYFTTLWPQASLYQLRDSSGPTPNASLVYTIPGAGALSGITAISSDTYVVGAAIFRSIGVLEPGTGAFWSIRVPTVGNGLGEAIAKKIADIPEAGFLNGFATLPQGICRHRCNTTVLAADSFNGQIWRVNIATGKYDVAIKVPEMAPQTALPVGINGIKIQDGYLYWTNAATTSIYRLAIDAQGTPTPGAAVETLFYIESAQLDDFTIDDEGNFWVATNADNRVIAIRPDGAQEVVVGGKGTLTVAGDTSVRFGRGDGDKQTLYVTTGGANSAPVNGTITEPAKIVAVDTSSYYL